MHHRTKKPTWESGDPATDIDDDLRPTTPGTADYAGVDIP